MTNKQSDFLKKVNLVPKNTAKKDLHYWADYLELICLINSDGIISIRDFRDRYEDAGIGEDEDDDEYIETESEDEESASEKSDRTDQWIQDIFTLCSYREKLFEEFYPFTVSSDFRTISWNSPFSQGQYLYIFLLYCSTLYACTASNSLLTSGFEFLCLDIFPSLLPNTADYYYCGSSNAFVNGSTRSNLITGSFLNKLQKIELLTKEKLRDLPAAQTDGNNGDGGLDIFGFIRLGDDLSHSPLFFGQCGCTPKWVDKQNSSGYNAWNQYFSLTTYPNNFIFVPYAFRSQNGEWHNSTVIQQTFLIDRFRILHLSKSKNEYLENFEGLQIINELIECKEAS